MRRMALTVLGFVVALSLVCPSWAEVSVQGDVRIVFGDDDQKMIRDYYGREIIEKAGGQEQKGQGMGKGKGHGKGKKGLPPGLAKKNKLPPGIQKQIERGAILPADIEKEVQPLPRELEVRLKPLPSSNQIRVTVGTDILILDKQTKKILDVMRDVALLAHDISK